MDKGTFIVDRIEDNIAVCEKYDKEMINIDISLIHGPVKEGDVLLYVDGIYKVSEKLTNERKDYIEKLTEGMWE